MGLFSSKSFDKLKTSLLKTKQNLIGKISDVLKISPKLDDSVIQQMEDILLSGDVGAKTTEIVLKGANEHFYKNRLSTTGEFVECLKLKLIEVVNDTSNTNYFEEIKKNRKPFLILIVGVNGVGKTTTIGKLAKIFKENGLSVIIGAADTFRAAANEQLEIWANRANVEIVRSSFGIDPGAIVYDTLQKALDKSFDVVLIDTAGRLHVKKDLMDELGKIQKIIEKKLGKLPDEVLMIIDANIGQNAVIQVKEFSKILKVTGLVLTKLDGTAKGGIVFQICQENNTPIRFIGIGEKIDDIELFNSESFVRAIFEN